MMKHINFSENIKKYRLEILFIAAFITYIILTFSDLVPNLKEINHWDEAVYINWGRWLLQGKIPEFSENPLLAFFYAIIYLPFSGSKFWLMQSCTAARFIFVALIWLGGYQTARNLQDILRPEILIGILFTFPLVTEILNNPSDSMFAALACLAFASLLAYWRQKKTSDLIKSSTFLGLSALTRNDGLVLFGIFFFLVLIISFPISRSWKKIGVGILPFILLVGGYVGIHGIVSGNFDLHLAQRSYLAFEQGQKLNADEIDGPVTVVDQMETARKLFGTPEENEYSIFRAILRNPTAFMARFKNSIGSIPKILFEIYNIKLAGLLLIFVIRGLILLIESRRYQLLLIFLLWPMFLGTYLLTFFRGGYFRTVYYIPFLLAAIAISWFLEHLDSKKEWGIWIGLLFLLIVYGYIDQKPAVIYAGWIFFACLLMIKTICLLSQERQQRLVIAGFLILAAGLILRGGFPAFKDLKYGVEPDEKAVVWMIDNLPSESRVMSGAPGVPWAARMKFIGLFGTDVPEFKTKDEFHRFLVEEDIEAIYLDFRISKNAPKIWGYIQELEENGLKRVFSEDKRSYQIFLVTR